MAMREVAAPCGPVWLGGPAALAQAGWPNCDQIKSDRAVVSPRPMYQHGWLLPDQRGRHGDGPEFGGDLLRGPLRTSGRL